MKIGTRFLTVDKMRPVKFIVRGLNPTDRFPYEIEAYEMEIRSVWVPVKYTEHVSLKWFVTRMIELIE